MKLIAYVALILFGLLLPTTTFAQEFTITGTISDSTKQPIAYANIILRTQNDSTIIAGTSSNEEGRFTLNNVEAASYVLTVSFIGYEDFNTGVSIEKDIALKTITLTEATEALSEVEITYKKPTLKKEVDRLVFNVEKSALTEGNMMEVLRSTPGVLVLDNKITIKNAPPTVYINDRKVHLSNEELSQLLESSSANTIKSIEVITNPPAKYDAESGAVLNIIMSKNLATGYNGSVYSNYTQGVFPRMNYGMNNFYKTSKVNIFANYSYTNKKENREGLETINFLDNGSIDERWITDTDRNKWTETHNFNFNFDYFINNNNTLSVSSNILLLPYFKYITKGTTNISDAANVHQSSFNSNNLSRDEKYNLGFDLDYVHDFKNEGKLSANAHLTTYDYTRDQDVNSDYFDQTNNYDFSTAFNTNANQNTDIYTGQLDYETPIDQTASFSAGIKASQITTESDITQFDIIGGTEILDPNNTDAFNYDESIYAAYLSYEKSWEKWSLSVGLRMEQTYIEGQSINDNINNKQDYLEWFPTLNLSHQASDHVSVYVNYKRSLERPNYQSLNPFKFYINDNHIFAGNPDLKPSFTDHVVLGTSISDTYIVEAYYKRTKGNVSFLPIQDNENDILIETPVNLDETIEFGFDFSTFFNITENWFVYFVTSFYNAQDETNFNGNSVILDKWTNYTVFSNDFLLLKDKSLTANFTFAYTSGSLQGLRETSSAIVTNLSLKKNVFKKKGTVSLYISDLLNEQDFSVSTKYLNQDNTTFSNLDNRYIKLGFSYKFGNTNLETNERTKERNERDRLEKKEL